MRLLGIDYGKKRIGIAISDPLGISALPLTVIENTKDSLDQIMQLIDKYELKKIIVGFPLKLDGGEGDSAEYVNKFIGLLEKRTDIPVVRYDERLTTAMVQKMLIGFDIKRKDRKNSIDKIAAAQLLSDYMLRNKHE